MKKYLQIGFVILLLLGCAKKQIIPVDEPLEEVIVLQDNQLYDLLATTIKEQHLLDALTIKPGYYVFAAFHDFEIHIENQEKRVEFDFVRGNQAQNAVTVSIDYDGFSYIDQGARKEANYSLSIHNDQILVDLRTFEYYYIALLYENGEFTINQDYTYPPIADISALPAAMLHELAKQIEAKYKQYESYINSAASAFQVLQDTILNTENTFVKGQESDFVTSTEDYNQMLYQMLAPKKQEPCSFYESLKEEQLLYDTMKALDVSTKDFTQSSDVEMNAKMAARILEMSEVYYHHNDHFVSSYTLEKVEGFSVPQSIAQNRYYYAVGFPDRYAKLQQQLFPDSVPFPLSSEIKLYNTFPLQLELDQGYVLYDVPEGDGPSPRATAVMIVSTITKDELITAEIAYYDVWNQFILDQAGNTYWYSDCTQDENHYIPLVSLHLATFDRREVTFRNRGNRYLEIVSFKTIQS